MEAVWPTFLGRLRWTSALEYTLVLKESYSIILFFDCVLSATAESKDADEGGQGNQAQSDSTRFSSKLLHQTLIGFTVHGLCGSE